MGANRPGLHYADSGVVENDSVENPNHFAEHQRVATATVVEITPVSSGVLNCVRTDGSGCESTNSNGIYRKRIEFLLNFLNLYFRFWLLFNIYFKTQ